MESVLLDTAGHRRSPATMPGYHRGRPPRNNGEEDPADPPTVEEIVAVMRRSVTVPTVTGFARPIGALLCVIHGPTGGRRW
ncbi:MAG: hypothetical protein WCB67_05570 [Solirubrobacteraceae bacterium]